MRPSITVPTNLARADVIDAVLAVNEAPTLDDAFRLLAEAARCLVAADSVTVVVSTDDAGDTNVIRVPLSTREPGTSLEARWDTALPDAEAAEARELLVGLAALTNVAERSLRERERRLLVETGKRAAVGELAAGVAHEINNPLFAILGLTEFLLKEAEPGTKRRERLELIQETGLEIKDIVRALLEFAREDAGERQVVPLEEVVESAVDLVRRTNANKGVELVACYDAGGALVVASPNQLKQIFLHLIAEARRAVPDGGVVQVAIRSEGDRLAASVSHDGPAPLDTSPGLAVSRGLAEGQGGTLEATGATFTLRLPVAEEGEPA